MLLLACAPWLVPQHGLTQLTLVLIYAIAGLGLMVLAGYTGLLSMGHAAFLGVGAYTHALLTNAGVPFPLSLGCAAILTTAMGLAVGLPALRLKGPYLGMATLSFGFIMEEVLVRWKSVTGGSAGIHVQKANLFGWELGSGTSFYFVCLVFTIAITLGVLNLLRSPTGRAFVAIRDSETYAQSMGIHLTHYKALSLAIAAALAGIAGALYAHNLQFITPEQFTFLPSINFLLMIMVGGMGSVHGAFLGAIFLVAMPVLLAQCKDYLPLGVGQAPGLQELVYGLILIAFVVFEPKGLYGRWLKIQSRHAARRQPGAGQQSSRLP